TGRALPRGARAVCGVPAGAFENTWQGAIESRRRLNEHTRGDTMTTRAGGLLLVLILSAASAFAATPCANLTALKLPNVAITLATVVPAGPLVQPSPAGRAARAAQDAAAIPAAGRGGAAAGAPPLILPTYCRVAATLTPSSDSDIKIEVWLPSAGWNGKYQAVGNGGWAGTLNHPPRGPPLRRGPPRPSH